MKMVKIVIALAFIVGAPNVVVSGVFLDMGHSVWLAPLSYLSAFIGTGIVFGFSDFADKPRFIGNIDDNYTKPRINQNWAVFFISLVINLTVANFCGNA